MRSHNAIIMKYESLESGHFSHIYNRGNNCEDLFVEERNYSYFLNLMRRHLLPTCSIYVYCLLKNHYHFVLCTNEDVVKKDISKSLSNLFNAYAKAINKAYERIGSLFQDRFSRKRIADEDYLRNLIIYMNTNVQNHGFMSDFRDYPYSSYRETLSGSNTIVNNKASIELFDDKENFKYCHERKKYSVENIFESLDY